MKLRFSLRYTTAWGESLYVVVEYISSDGRSRISEICMNTVDGQLWTVETSAIDSRKHPLVMMRYSYQVRGGDGKLLRKEWSLVPRILPFNPSYDYVMDDAWRDVPLQHHLYTNAYATASMGRRNEVFVPVDMALFRKTILFSVSAPQLSKGQAVALCGSHPVLGQWNTSRYLKMQYAGQAMWMLSVNAMGMTTPMEYKYVIVDEATGDFVAWEEGANRQLDCSRLADGQVAVADGGLVRVCEAMWKVAGVAVPVFSLRSEHSCGIGDFGDLRLLIDWASATGMKAVQVLPLNDTGAMGRHPSACPYDIISAYAINPCYIDLDALGPLADKRAMTRFHKQRMELNAMRHCNHEASWRVKSDYIRAFYEERGDSVVRSAGFNDFVEANRTWLEDYAAFCLLSDDYSSLDCKHWGRYARYDANEVGLYLSGNKGRAAYVYYVQYLLHTQLKQAAEYAQAKGVFLMCDVPIGLSRRSVDVWVHPDLFDTGMQAGTMPDAEVPNGQNWGFPTYRWERMMADGCRWWQGRLAHLSQYFDAFRMDHVLGFFRIWEIPSDAVSGILGHFSPSLPLTPEEIERFGLVFRQEPYTRPFINDRVLDKVFGIHAQYVRDTFLVAKAYSMYALRPECDTQVKVRALFDGKTDENSLWIRDGLYRLIENVLFIEDEGRRGAYHPRVGAYCSPVFAALNDDDREAFMRIYNNYYYQRHDMHWGWYGMRRLQAVLGQTRMLACAEDLGTMPPCVEPVLDALRVLTLSVQSMPRQPGQEFSHLNANPYRSVATISTHDMPPMRLWWEESHERAQRYYSTMMQKEGRAPFQMPVTIAEEIVARHLYCPSMLCILSLQDWLAMDAELRSKDVRSERVNVPGAAFGGWGYRMHITLERLLGADRFSNKLMTMIKRSRR